jgi:hypothetical protein
MLKEKLFYLDCLKDGKLKHNTIFGRMKKLFSTSATVVRDALLEEGYIIADGFTIRNDGKRDFFYKLTDKRFAGQDQPQKADSFQWEDGSFKSKGNAFDWKNYAKGVYTQSELAAKENGRKWGVATASKKILPRVSI